MEFLLEGLKRITLSRFMKIGVDAGCLGVRDERLKVGVYTVVKNLLIELGKSDKKNSYLLYSFYPIERELLAAFGRNMKNIVIPSRGWLRISLPLRLLKDRPDVFLAANQALPVQLPFARYKTVGLFYDIAFEKFPSLYSYAASVKKHRDNSKYLAQHADLLLAISKSTKKDIEDFYHILSKKILIAHPGIVALKKQSSYKSKKPYFLFVGAFKKSKNIPVLLSAFATFRKKSKKDYQLLLVGGDKWLDPEIGKTLASLDKNTQKNIVQLGFVDEKRLVSLYSSAVAFVSPSLYEGFGLPFLEAQSLDCPVIASNQGALPEVVSTSGILVDPTNHAEIIRAMEKISFNKSLRLSLIKKGKQNIKKYSWKTFAKTVQSAIEHVA